MNDTGYEWIIPMLGGIASTIANRLIGTILASPSIFIFLLAITTLLFPRLALWIATILFTLFVFKNA